MSERTFIKNFNNFRGRDIRSSDLIRDFDYAIEFENARVVKEDSCVKRPGFNTRGASGQYNGLYTYRYTNSDTGQTIEELISLSDSVFKKSESAFVVTYTGSDPIALLSIRLDTSTQTFKCIIIEGTVTVLSYDIGTGYELIPKSLDDLKTAIDAVTDFSASISGTTTIPAAFLPITLSADLASLPNMQSIVVSEWRKLNTLIDAVFTNYHVNRGVDEWELASCVNINDCLFIATGYEYLHKYDGQNVYRAGLPFAEPVPELELVSTGWTDTNVKYIYLYKQIDNRGNTILGVDSDPSDAVSPSSQSVNVTVPNLVAGSGFNTGGAVVSGDQSGVTTITVNSAHTLKVGDTAYFYDGVTGDYIERLITAKSNTTITIAGAAVDVLTNYVVSNNLRIVIYRTTAGGALYFKVVEVPNNSYLATQVVQDSFAPANLGSQYIPPTKLRDILDFKPRYLCVHQGLLIASGAPNAANAWFFSNGEGPEYFDAEINVEQIKAASGGGVRGLGSDQEHLIIGTNSTLFVVTGDLDGGSARIERLGNVGFACHNTIVDIGDKLVFLSGTGFWSVQNGFNLEEIGQPINPDFINTLGLSAVQLPQYRRAFAIYFEETREYICFVPAESNSGVDKYINTNAVVHTYDAFHNAWGIWKSLNMGGGLAVYNDNIYFQSKRSDAFFTVTGNLWQRSALGTIDDYADHDQPINFQLGPQWIDAGEPSVYKVFLWFKVYSLLRQTLPATFNLSVSLERDFNRGVTWASFEVLLGGFQTSQGWGFFAWGEAGWGTPEAQASKIKLRSGKAQSLRYLMTNNLLHQKVALSAWETVITAPYNTELVS